MRKERVRKSSGNIFQDLGFLHPERLMARSQVMSRITQIIREKHLTQEKAAKLLGIPQSKVSCLMNGKLSLFSLDHLFSLLNALDNNVEIVIKTKREGEKKATTSVWLEAA